mgnify:CR=1 FL=1
MVRMTCGFWYTLCHAELVSGTVRGEKLVKGAEKIPIKARSEILKQVIRLRSSKTSLIILRYGQDDIWRYLLLILSFWDSQFNTSVKKHNPCAIKILYKTTFSYKSSWKAGNALLEKYYFPTGKLFFLSWKFIFFQ